MSTVSAGARKASGLLGRIVLWQIVAMPVHLIGALICIIIENEIIIQG
jgi:hypothetical protein